MSEKIDRQTYTVPQFGRMLGVGKNQVYEAVKRGEIPTIKIGKRLLVPKAAGDRLLENGQAA